MTAQRKFDWEARGRLAETDDSKLAVRRYVAELLGINQATLRNSVDHQIQQTGPQCPTAVPQPFAKLIPFVQKAPLDESRLRADGTATEMAR